RCASVIFCLAVLAAPTDLGTLSLHDALPILGYKTPVLRTASETWEPYALEVLAGILDGGASARFARELVRGQQVAAGAGAGYNRSEEHTSELQSREKLVCRLLLEKKKEPDSL